VGASFTVWKQSRRGFAQLLAEGFVHWKEGEGDAKSRPNGRRLYSFAAQLAAPPLSEKSAACGRVLVGNMDQENWLGKLGARLAAGCPEAKRK
jgi:hypothetical protein